MSLTLAQHRVFGAVERYGGLPRTVRDIADELGVTNDHCSRVAKDLYDLGWLERSGSGSRADPYLYSPPRMDDPEARCRVCGCTEQQACHDPTTPNGGCYWVEPDLCSVCVAKA